jgi:hypothetical protein
MHCEVCIVDAYGLVSLFLCQQQFALEMSVYEDAVHRDELIAKNLVATRSSVLCPSPDLQAY